MTLGMSLETFTVFHVIVSLVGIGSGFVVMFGLLTGKRLDGWTALFLVTTIATSVTGFGFPFDHLLPSHVVGILSLLVLALAVAARYAFRLAGGWRRVYAISATTALYFNMFVLVVQGFLKVPALHALAPHQSEPPFAVAQGAVLVVFIVLGVLAAKGRYSGAAAVGALLIASLPAAAATPVAPGFSDRFADVNGVRLHYVIGGKGSPVVLLHGYAQTGHMWTPILPLLAAHHTVIVPDLRGAGGSAKPESGYDKKNMAVDIHELTSSLGFERVRIVGHDIGLMVAYAYAAQFPKGTDRVVLMDAFLPGVGDWKSVWLMRDLWHFHFYGVTPLALVSGRERTYFEHFWNDFAADPKHSVSEADRQVYAAAYAQPGGMRAGFEYFRNFERDARDFAELSATKLSMPMLVLTGEKASGQALIDQARLVATDVKGVIVPGSGHWLIDEAPERVIPELVAFLDQP